LVCPQPKRPSSHRSAMGVHSLLLAGVKCSGQADPPAVKEDGGTAVVLPSTYNYSVNPTANGKIWQDRQVRGKKRAAGYAER